ncbi:uncharacterized protein LOC131937588 [Physella acuta]|uniref:uncharacterized protein LOC131937588 n=1 Tax=Physella acuta TaxID=109671 RepID=UPI0027DB491B|nr:uncharacterized protein LOC131937588 [Physella acuta]
MASTIIKKYQTMWVIISSVCVLFVLFAVLDLKSLTTGEVIRSGQQINATEQSRSDKMTTTQHSRKAWPGVSYVSSKRKYNERMVHDNKTTNMHLFRDYYSQEFWPGVEDRSIAPGEVHNVVHYFWCGQKIFKFEDYLSILSVVRILKPQKILFYYQTIPYIDPDWYHLWFEELRQSVPNLVLKETKGNFTCGSEEVLRFILDKLSVSGGVYVGERTILTGIPIEVENVSFYYSFKKNEICEDVTQGVIFSREGFPTTTMETKLKDILNTKNNCFSLDELNALPFPLGYKDLKDVQPCAVVWYSLQPKDIWNVSSNFAELARWLTYGKRERQFVEPSTDVQDLIPLISHLVWIQHKSDPFEFLHFLSVMSALHVAGVHTVYIHGDQKPHGPWWDELDGENVVFVKIDKTETIYQQVINGASHQSDILRALILYKYGGIYQDRDVIWVKKIPEHLRWYPAVSSIDWPQYGVYPAGLNTGVLLAKAGNMYLQNHLKFYRYYMGDKWLLNAIMMSYKAYEQQPNQLLIDDYLQVICFKGKCHPIWNAGPDEKFWEKGLALHFTHPTPVSSLESPNAIKNSSDIFSTLGRMILERSGRLDILEQKPVST